MHPGIPYQYDTRDVLNEVNLHSERPLTRLPCLDRHHTADQLLPMDQLKWSLLEISTRGKYNAHIAAPNMARARQEHHKIPKPGMTSCILIGLYYSGRLLADVGVKNPGGKPILQQQSH